ncbi:hypothetical protein IB235_14320 [Paracoccus sp. PAR01]|nr:hypothetical protein [Paracoccus sp. PAR01]MBD9527992.1 hypothetical protein [Paracoccus sp. PAR01]
MHVIPSLPLRSTRVHEACGPSAAVFAAIACSGTKGRLLWICEDRRMERLLPTGLAEFIDPDRLMVADTRNQTDTLAVAEEALKDGAIALVVMEITRPLNLREGRRLQLAAKAGNATGLCLIPEGMGSNAAETRWRCSPVFDPEDGGDSTLMQWEIIKNKKGTLGAWHVRWNAATHRLDVVSPVADGPGAATVPD